MASKVRFVDSNITVSPGGGSSGGSSLSSSYALSSSHADFATSASYADYAVSASHEITKEVSSSYADTASLALSGNGPFTGSFTGSFIGNGTGLFSGSFSGSITDAYQIISGSVSASISPDNGLRINSPVDITMPSGSVFTIHEPDIDQENRLDFRFDQGNPMLEIASRFTTSSLYLRSNQTDNGLIVESSGKIKFIASGATYAVQFTTTGFNPNAPGQLNLGAYNRRWKDFYINNGNKISFGVSDNSNIDLVSFRHTANTNTLVMSGSSDVLLNVKGAISASGDISGSDLRVRDGRFSRDGGAAEIEIIASEIAGGIIGTQTSDNLLFRRFNIPKFTISESRNFSHQRLDVEGDIEATGIISASKMTVSASSDAEPGYTFWNNSTTGMLSTSPTNLKFQIDGTGSPELELTTGQATFRVPVSLNDNEISSVSRIRALGSISASGDFSSSISSTASFGTYLGDGSQLTGISAGFWTGSNGIITRDSDVEITGSLDVTQYLNLGKNLSNDGRIIFYSDTGPSFELGVVSGTGNDTFSLQGSSGAQIQNFALDSKIENFIIKGGGSINIEHGASTGSYNGGGIHINRQDTALSNGTKGIFSTDVIGPYIGNSSYGGTGTHGTFRIINGLNPDNNADSGSFTVAEFGDFINFSLPITASSNLSSSATSTASFGTYLGDGSQLTGIETDPFPYTGDAVISGSLTVQSGSTNSITGITLVNPSNPGSTEDTGAGITMFNYTGATGSIYIKDYTSGGLNPYHPAMIFNSSDAFYFKAADDARDGTWFTAQKVYQNFHMDQINNNAAEWIMGINNGGSSYSRLVIGQGSTTANGWFFQNNGYDKDLKIGETTGAGGTGTYTNRILISSSRMQIGDSSNDLKLSVSGSITSNNTSSAAYFVGDGSQLTNLPASDPFPYSGSAIISSSGATASLTLEGSGSTVFDIIGSQGTLFSVDDDLSGTIFTANDISGLPILEASASGDVYIGKSPQSLYTTAVISTTIAATTQSIFGLSTSSYDGAFFDYTVQSGSDARAGSIMAVWNGGNISFTETTTTDIGNTTDFNLIVHISQSQA